MHEVAGLQDGRFQLSAIMAFLFATAPNFGGGVIKRTWFLGCFVSLVARPELVRNGQGSGVPGRQIGWDW